MSFPNVVIPSLPTSTIVPQNEDLFIPYLNRLYEEIAFTVNNKDNTHYTIAITNTAQSIPNLPNFGAYIICVSGLLTGLPCITAALSKSSATGAGVVTVLNSQVGSAAPWIGATLTITSTASNFQIRHSVAATTGNFNVRIIGTQ